MKTLPPILFALFMTGLVAVSMVIVGANALLNTNTVPTASSPADGSPTAPASPSAETQTVQLQQLVSQYQQRDQQYQSQITEAVKRLNTANQQLQQANQEVQTYQQVLSALQERGVIRIDNNGQIFLGQGNGGERDGG